MRKIAFVLAAGLLLAPVGAAAQVCLGYPATRGQSDIGGVIRLQSGLSQFGGTYSGHYQSDVVADGLLTYDHYSHDNGFTAGARVGLALRSTAIPPALSICPNAGLYLGHISGFNTLTIPIGFGIGTVLPLENGSPYRNHSRLAPATAGTSLLIFATPAFAYQHRDHGSDTFVMSEFGARFLFSSFYLGASVIAASGNRDAHLGINAGVPLPMVR